MAVETSLIRTALRTPKCADIVLKGVDNREEGATCRGNDPPPPQFLRFTLFLFLYSVNYMKYAYGCYYVTN